MLQKGSDTTARKNIDTAFCYTSMDYMEVSSDEKKWINKVHKLKQQRPDEVTIIKEPENNNGCIYARLPVAWLKIQPSSARKLSDEERVMLAERLRNCRKNSQNSGSETQGD